MKYDKNRIKSRQCIIFDIKTKVLNIYISYKTTLNLPQTNKL